MTKKTYFYSLFAATMLSASASMAAQPLAIPPATQDGLTQGVAIQAGQKISDGALGFVRATTEKGLKSLTNPASSKAQKKQDFRRLLDAHFDLDTIGRFALGTYWNKATAAERQEYLRLFKQMVVDIYSTRFDNYKGQQLDVRTMRTVNERDSIVSSYLLPADGGQELQIDWRVRKEGNSYKVVDVIVAGVSMSVTQRSDFASVIQRGGGNVSALLTELRQGRVAQN